MAIYKVTVEYEIEFNMQPESLAVALDNVLRLNDTENETKIVDAADWQATVTLKQKLVEEL